MSLIRLLDVSGIFHPVWRVKESQGRPIGEAAAETVQALREHAARGGADHVVACCDATGRNFRHEVAEEYRAIFPEYRGYKSHRPEKDAAMMAALDRVIDELEQDGVPVMRATGYEADDIIATLAHWAVSEGHSVEVVSEDKDLLQLVVDGDDTAPAVVVVRRDGTRQDAQACVERLGVPPQLVPAFLALAGDTSDGVLGIPSVGKKTATGLLWGEFDDARQWRPTSFRRFDDVVNAAVEEQAYVEQVEREKLRRRVAKGTKQGASDQKIADTLKIPLDDVAKYRALGEFEFPADYKPRFPENIRKSLIANASSFDIGMRLTRLATDVPLDFTAVTAPRVPKPKSKNFQVDGYDDEQPKEEDDDFMDANDHSMHTPTAQPQPMSAQEPVPSSATVTPSEIVSPGMAPASAASSAPMSVHVAPQPRAELAVREIQQVTEQALAPRAGAYSLNLDPRDFREARMLAKDIYDAKIFPKIQSPQQALAFIMTGREYGLPAMAALRLIHLIEGQMAVHAQVKIGMAMKSPRVEYMHIKEWVDDGEKSYCIWVGKRRGRPKEDSCRYGVEDARRQMLVKEKSNWIKMPGWMSMVRSGANMATILIPDEMAGLYTFDEMGAAEVVLYGGANEVTGARQVAA
jgi:5'-3' exonuclease